MTEDQDILRRRANYKIQQKVKFVVVLQAKLQELLIILSPTAIKCLMYIVSKIYLNNKSYNMPVYTIAKKTNMSYTTAKKAMKELAEHKVVYNVGTRTNPVYMVDPSFAFKGTFAYQDKMTNEYMKYFGNGDS